jgi:hypothetical protein
MDNILKMLNEINNNLNILNNRIEILENKIDIIYQKQINIDLNTHKMSSHVDFVEDVYEKVRNPLGFLTNRLNNMLGSNNEINFPELEERSDHQ